MALATPHILVAEDDRALASFMREVLENAGYKVRLAPNGRVALDDLEQHSFALVVLDLVMPGMDGIEFRLRQLQHSSRWLTPVLVVSGHDRVETLALSIKAEGCLSKPFTADELIEAVREVLAARGTMPLS